MHTHLSLDGRVHVLKPSGHFLGGPETTEFVDVAKDLVKQGNLALLVDLSEVDYMNSLGLGALTRILISYSTVHGVVKICNLRDRVRKLFDVVKFYKIFEYYESEHAAVEAFSKEMANPV